MNICGILNVNSTYTDGLIRRHYGLLAEMVLYFSVSVMMLNNCYDTVIQLNIFEAVK